jgi:CRP/FNR family cyclic AMP-dependent transcriptional regulator
VDTNLTFEEQSAPTLGGADRDEVASAVMQHPFFEGFQTEQLDQLAQCARLREFQPADLIFKQGDPARVFYLIVWGTVSLTHAGLKGNTAIQTLSAGDALGWSWLFPPYGWHFNAMATAPTRLIEFDGERLRQLCREQHDFGYEFMNRIAQVVIDRLQKTRRKLFKLTGGM